MSFKDVGFIGDQLEMAVFDSFICEKMNLKRVTVRYGSFMFIPKNLNRRINTIFPYLYSTMLWNPKYRISQYIERFPNKSMEQIFIVNGTELVIEYGTHEKLKDVAQRALRQLNGGELGCIVYRDYEHNGEKPLEDYIIKDGKEPVIFVYSKKNNE